MKEDAFDIKNYSFKFPEYSEDEWLERIKNEKGITKEILTTQIKVLNLMKSINNREVTPARLAWINLWSKCVSLLDGTYAALSGHSAFILVVLERIALETLLHTLTIAEPVTKFSSTDKALLIDNLNKYGNKTIDRLCAYTAWTLSSDSKFIWAHMKKVNMDMIWNPEPARRIILNPQKYEKYKAIFGEITIDIDPVKLRMGRKKQESHLKESRQRIEKWLEHPDLIKWQKKIREYNDHNDRSTPNNMSFFQLFNEDEKSISKKMQNLGFGFEYLEYKKASLLIHGSTIEQLNITTEDVVYPAVISNNEAIEEYAEIIRSECFRIAIFLDMFKKIMWP